MSHILLIDDDDSLREMIRLTLEALGHHVTSAADGKAGLAAQLAAPAELVLTDLVMPGMEGMETIMELRRRNSALKIIAMSGGGRINSAEYLRVARQLGACVTLAKPFIPQELNAAVIEALAKP
jgi:DNA-binding response OmpR family regulator